MAFCITLFGGRMINHIEKGMSLLSEMPVGFALLDKTIEALFY
jgi:hypothetical protein